MMKDIVQLTRLLNDRRKPEFKSAPLWLVISINSEIGLIKQRLNPFNWTIKITR